MLNRKDFYKSKAWNDVRKTVWLKQNLLCSRCKKPVYVDGISNFIPKEQRRIGIVHHKIYLNDINVNDINITLNTENLEGLCLACHNKEHFSNESTRDDYYFDEEGNINKRG